MSKKKVKKNMNVVSKTNKPTRDIKKDKGMCHHCSKEGHQRRNCKEYLATMKVKKLNEASTSSMFIIENYLTALHYSSLVLDTKCCFHFCNCMQEVKKSGKLVEDKMDLQLSNEVGVTALAIGTTYALVVGVSYFVLPNGLIV